MYIQLHFLNQLLKLQHVKAIVNTFGEKSNVYTGISSIYTIYCVPIMHISNNDMIVTQPSLEADDTIIVPQIHVCSSSFNLHFSGALYIVQGLTMAFGAFLSWETRKASLVTNVANTVTFLVNYAIL